MEGKLYFETIFRRLSTTLFFLPFVTACFNFQQMYNSQCCFAKCNVKARRIEPRSGSVKVKVGSNETHFFFFCFEILRNKLHFSLYFSYFNCMFINVVKWFSKDVLKRFSKDVAEGLPKDVGKQFSKDVAK
jgi:hypothetical protein